MYDSPISKSSEIQRIGRVGRKFDGIAYNMYSSDASNTLLISRAFTLITESLDVLLILNFNKMNFIKKIPIELVYDSVYNLIILGFLKLNDSNDINAIYDNIKFDTENGYIINGKLTSSGIVASDIINNIKHSKTDGINILDKKY